MLFSISTVVVQYRAQHEMRQQSGAPYLPLFSYLFVQCITLHFQGLHVRDCCIPQTGRKVESLHAGPAQIALAIVRWAPRGVRFVAGRVCKHSTLMDEYHLLSISDRLQ